MARSLKPWVPVILWMGFIFVMSTDAGSANHTSRVIEPILRWVKPDVSNEAVGFAHLIVRKLGHLTEYAVLAVLLWRALGRSGAARVITLGSWRIGAMAWSIATAYAITDEFHQSFVATRTPSAEDVIIDACGALIGVLVCVLAHGAGWRLARATRP